MLNLPLSVTAAITIDMMPQKREDANTISSTCIILPMSILGTIPPFSKDEYEQS
jgi:hypothetical protein